MTKSEASFFFSYDESLDLKDQFEDKLFVFKQFFTAKPPVPKVFLSKLGKLDKMYQAYLVLGGEAESSEASSVSMSLQSDLLGSYMQYYALRGSINRQVMASTNVAHLTSLVKNQLSISRAYAKQWQADFDDLKGVLVSKEPDPMMILSELEKLNNSTDPTIEEVLKLDSENVLLAESKRLSLWLKLDDNV